MGFYDQEYMIKITREIMITIMTLTTETIIIYHLYYTTTINTTSTTHNNNNNDTIHNNHDNNTTDYNDIHRYRILKEAFQKRHIMAKSVVTERIQ